MILPPNNNNNDFALITSMAHCAGDGQTYYALHNMLSSAEDNNITSLNVHRKMEITQRIEDALGSKEQASAFDPNVGFILRFLGGIITSKLLAGPATIKLFTIPQEWIERQKKKESGEWISTNDIITSTFLRVMDCDQATMAINFREKLDNCCADDAGNYFQQLILRPSDFQSPAQIRSIVSDLKNNRQNRNTIPMTSWEHIRSSKPFGAISNWSTFSKPVVMGKCRPKLHMPLLDPTSIPSRFTSGLFIFRPDDSPDRIAALFAGHPDVLKKLQIETGGMIGDDLTINNV